MAKKTVTKTLEQLEEELQKLEQQSDIIDNQLTELDVDGKESEYYELSELFGLYDDPKRLTEKEINDAIEKLRHVWDLRNELLPLREQAKPLEKQLLTVSNKIYKTREEIKRLTAPKAHCRSCKCGKTNYDW